MSTLGWRNVGKVRPAFAREINEGEESVWDYPRPPAIVPDKREVVVKNLTLCNLIATSRNAIRILETASPPTFYIPAVDCRMELLEKVAGKKSFCEWKGEATYWKLRSMGGVVGWSYGTPNPRFEVIAGFMSFYASKAACFVDDVRVQPQPSDFYGGWVTKEVIGPFKGDPSIDWSLADSH